MEKIHVSKLILDASHSRWKTQKEQYHLKKKKRVVQQSNQAKTLVRVKDKQIIETSTQ